MTMKMIEYIDDDTRPANALGTDYCNVSFTTILTAKLAAFYN